jgi:hypothetical protein
MPSDENMPRITFSLGSFEEKVMIKMAKKREVSKSEIIRNLIHNWIEENSELLRNNYGIVLEDIYREMRLESGAQNLMEELLNSFKRTRKIQIDRLSAKLDVNPNDLLRFIDDHGDNLEKNGLNLAVDGDQIVRV